MRGMRTNQRRPAARGVRARVPALPVLAGVVAGALAGGLAGCGNVTSGGLGEVEVLVSPDSVADFAMTAMTAMTATAAMPAGDGASGFVLSTDEPLEGTLTVVVQSYLRLGRARWIEITDGPRELTLPLEDPTPVLVARARLPEGEYEAVRTVFGRMRVNVTSGLTVDGEPFSGELRVPIGPGGILVAEERGVRVEQGRPLPLLLELRARHWLPAVDRQRREVDEADFLREIRVRLPFGR